MFGSRGSWVRLSKRLRSSQHRTRFFCNNQNQLNNINKKKNGRVVNDIRNLDAYRDLDNLDFMKAARILFSNPTKKKTFGLDFHLVQLFFALLPSLAVYLVAQYARYEMKIMDAELEVKKKAEEEKKAKEMEAVAAEKNEAGHELLQVKERIEALEEIVKEIVVDTKKQTRGEEEKKVAQNQERQEPKSRSGNGQAAAGNQPEHLPREATPGSGKLQEQQDSENRGSQKDEK